MEKSPTIFIVSSGRSGTTLLVSMLNASGQIYIPYESDFVARAYPIYKDKKAFTWIDYQQICEIFHNTSQPKGWGMQKDYLIDYLKQHNPQTFEVVHSRICEAYHKLGGTENLLWGIKAPVLIASLDRIFAVHPDAKIIHIIRDGRDVYLSYKTVHEKSKVRFGPNGAVATALYWIDGLRRIEESSHQYQDRIYEFRYEDLLNCPEHELQQLCSFLAINYVPFMQEGFQTFEKNRQLIPANLMENLHTKVAGNIDPSNIGKYLMRMSKRDRFLFELFAISYLKKYGYTPSIPWLETSVFTPLRTLTYFCSRTFNDVRYARRDQRVSLKSNIAAQTTGFQSELEEQV